MTETVTITETDRTAVRFLDRDFDAAGRMLFRPAEDRIIITDDGNGNLTVQPYSTNYDRPNNVVVQIIVRDWTDSERQPLRLTDTMFVLAEMAPYLVADAADPVFGWTSVTLADCDLAVETIDTDEF